MEPRGTRKDPVVEHGGWPTEVLGSAESSVRNFSAHHRSLPAEGGSDGERSRNAVAQREKCRGACRGVDAGFGLRNVMGFAGRDGLWRSADSQAVIFCRRPKGPRSRV